MSRARLSGIVVPIVTLFDRHGSIDEAANVRHIEWLLGKGVHGIFALGTTGEFVFLSPGERRAVAELAVRTVRGRVPVLIGVSSPSTDEAVDYAEHAEEIGASGVVATPPYYWLPPDRSIYAHYECLAAATALPLYIYNFPALTGRNVSAPLIARLAADCPTIAGLKDTIDSIAHIQEAIALAKAARPEFSVLCGMDYHLLSTVLLGGDGCVPGTANFAPEPFVAVYAAAAGGRLEEAAERARAIAGMGRLFAGDAPPFAIIKEAMVLAGLIPHAVSRTPVLPLDADERRRLREELQALGVAR